MQKYLMLLIGLILNAPLLAANKDTTLYLIPQPKNIEVRNGTYNFERPFSISSINTDKFYAAQLQNAIEQKVNVEQIPLKAGNKITLLTATGEAFDSIIKAEKLRPPFELGNEGYVVSVSAKNILVLAHESAGVFYGVQTLIQLIKANSSNGAIPCVVIYDKPDMAMRGWQDDISRGPIPTMDFLKEEIRRMAGFKLNTFTLYTEHVFKLKQNPEIAPPDGITAEQVKELVEFAGPYNVDIIGNFQSFGHFANILKVPGYDSLAENASTLSPAKEASYNFLKDVYSEVVPAYNSKYFHINCDEVELGNGPCKSMIDSMGVDGVYAYHINRINTLLQPYHKRIMMWGDIAVHNPKIIDRLPKDMIIVSWNYGPLESMDDEILPFAKSGFDFIVAPGVSCWSRIYPDVGRASINIYNYLRDGYKNHAPGFINTTWDDDGQNLFNNNWYSLTWGAACGWNAPLNVPAIQSDSIRTERLSAFNSSYNRINYGTDKDITTLLLGISNLRNGPVKNCLSDGAIWNPLLPDYNIIPDNYERNNLQLIKTIDSLYTEANKLQPYFGDKANEFGLLTFALRQALLVAHKNLLSIKLKNYIASDSTKNISYFEKDFKALSDTIKQLKAAYGKLWALENRNCWLDTVYADYDSFSVNLNKLKGVCIINAANNLVNGKRKITLRSAFNNLPVYYTTDGTMPTINSIKYTQPIYTDSSIYLKARVIDNSGMYDVQSDSLVYHKGIGKLYKLNSQYKADNVAYAARGKYALLDGRRGSRNNFSDGRWQGYLDTNINMELDLGDTIAVSKITMGFAQLMKYGILFPRAIEISTSPDGINYTLIKTIENTIDPKIEERMTHDYTAELNGAKMRYIKVVAINSGKLPDWHEAKGKASWLFADEVLVE